MVRNREQTLFFPMENELTQSAIHGPFINKKTDFAYLRPVGHGLTGSARKVSYLFRSACSEQIHKQCNKP